MKFRNMALALFVCALVVPVYGLGKAGKWEMTMSFDMPGMPMKMPPQTFTHCITKEQAENPEANIPKNQRDTSCKYENVKVEGHTISWTVTCEKSHMTGTGKVTYADDSYEGQSDMKMQGDREAHVKYTGKYIGPCDEK